MRVLLCVLLPLLLLACSNAEGPETGVPGDSLAPEVVAPEDAEYEVFLVGSMPDTLRGRAHFGDVVDGSTGKPVSVVRLDIGFDFGGGIFLTRGDAQFPAPGTYPVEPFPADSIRNRGVPQGFSARYRRGLNVNLRATGGTLTLETVTDTLVAGRFEIDLEGLLALPGGTPREGVVRALGRFEAENRGAGYIIGF